MEVNEGPGRDAPDTTPPEQAEQAPPVTPEASNAAEAAEAQATESTPPAEPVAEAPAEEPAAEAPAERPAAPAPAAASTERPARSTSDVPGRVPEPSVPASPVRTINVSMGVQLENQRLTPIELEEPKAFYRSVLPGIMQVPADFIIAAARKSSLWPMTFGLACCAIEMIATYMSHHDLDRFGIVPWPSPRQCDVMIVAGTVTKKMAPAVKLLYAQMPNPKWVISMGACATNGGPYTRYDRVLQGVDKIIPVDVYVPGCPPRPEALIDGFIALQNKIMEERSRVG
jgi:NADH-quinone oxidoreductase subunit B